MRPMRLVNGERAPRLARLGFALLLASCSRSSSSRAPVPVDSTSLPAWAYPVDPPTLAPAPDDGGAHGLPGSSASFSRAVLDDLLTAPDWYPGDHPTMPALAAHGTPPSEYACAYCHLPNGLGRPENASLAGLPAAYIVQQVRDFSSGARTSSVPNRAPQTLMSKLSQVAATDPRLAEVAAYFASMKPATMTKVVETDTVPKTTIQDWVARKAPALETEPMGDHPRIVEVPDDSARFDLRDPRMTFTAYVPPGSIERGRTLATTGGGKTIRCGSCHGVELRGSAAGPPLAGRSPSYMARQLYDFKTGARDGAGGVVMKSVVMNLNDADVVALCAYAASRKL